MTGRGEERDPRYLGAKLHSYFVARGVQAWITARGLYVNARNVDENGFPVEPTPNRSPQKKARDRQRGRAARRANILRIQGER